MSTDVTNQVTNKMTKEFTEQMRRSARLLYAENMSVDKIAQIFNSSVSTVQSWLALAAAMM